MARARRSQPRWERRLNTPCWRRDGAGQPRAGRGGLGGTAKVAGIPAGKALGGGPGENNGNNGKDSDGNGEQPRGALP